MNNIPSYYILLVDSVGFLLLNFFWTILVFTSFYMLFLLIIFFLNHGDSCFRENKKLFVHIFGEVFIQFYWLFVAFVKSPRCEVPFANGRTFDFYPIIHSLFIFYTIRSFVLFVHSHVSFSMCDNFTRYITSMAKPRLCLRAWYFCCFAF